MNALKRGFTMIELLVVIVILGILAASLFGPVTSFLNKGKLMGMMGNGRKVVQAIIAADMDGRYQGMAWPMKTSDASASEYSGTGPDMTKTFNSTADYFTQALYLSETSVTKRNRLKVLKEIEPSMIAGEGVPTATGTTIQKNNCAWNLAVNAHVAPSVAPVFITRNLNVTALLSAKGNDKTQGPDELLTAAKPFGKDGCVAIYKDGAGKMFAAADLYPEAMLTGLGNESLQTFGQEEGAQFGYLDTTTSN